VVERLQSGDFVRVTYVSNSIRESYDAKIIHTPQGEGDTHQVETEDGTVHIVNVYCLDLIGMKRLVINPVCPECHTVVKDYVDSGRYICTSCDANFQYEDKRW